MKYGKIIKNYMNEIKKIDEYNINLLYGINNSILEYKKLKGIIKKLKKNEHTSLYIYENCAICLEELGGDNIVLKCSHAYHMKCITLMAKNSNNCSLCRRNITENLPIKDPEYLKLCFIATLIINIETLYLIL